MRTYSETSRTASRALVWHGSALSALFAGVLFLAPHLDVASPQRALAPWAIYAFVGLSAVAGILWWSASDIVRRRRHDASAAIWVVVGFAVLFRVLVVAVPPILELDLYRYLWDGFVSTNGVSAFRYSPAEVVEAIRLGETDDTDLRALAIATEGTFGASEILGRVHYPDLPTIYPPVAQWFFAACAFVAYGASIETRILILKTALVACECATLVCVVALLHRFGRPTALIILPAWCPLAVLSVANQGHLDSLPTMFTVAAFTVAVVGTTRTTAALAGVFIALGAGAKIYPLLLTPLVAVFVLKAFPQSKRLQSFASLVAAWLIASVFIWAPMFRTEAQWKGLSTFAGEWEMYDAAFAVVRANVELVPEAPRPWYSVVPADFIHRVGLRTGATRILWIAATGLLALILTWQVAKRPESTRLLTGSMLLLVFFWAAGPVCNPWYLLWALPFLPFVDNRGWMTLFVLAPTFFLRFGLAAQFGERGEYWFDHGLIFALTAGWIAPLVISRRAAGPSTTSPQEP